MGRLAIGRTEFVEAFPGGPQGLQKVVDREDVAEVTGLNLSAEGVISYAEVHDGRAPASFESTRILPRSLLIATRQNGI